MAELKNFAFTTGVNPIREIEGSKFATTAVDVLIIEQGGPGLET